LADGEQKGIVAYPGITEERINHYVDQGLRDFYLRPAFMLKFLFSTRSLSDLYRKLRGAWNFFKYQCRSIFGEAEETDGIKTPVRLHLRKNPKGIRLLSVREFTK